MAYYGNQTNNKAYYGNSNQGYGNNGYDDHGYVQDPYYNQAAAGGQNYNYDAYNQGGYASQPQQQGGYDYNSYGQSGHNDYYNQAPASANQHTYPPQAEPAAPKSPNSDLPKYNNDMATARNVPNWNDEKKGSAGPFASNVAEVEVKSKRRGCAMRPLYWIILGVVGVILAVLGIVAYFYWPSMPDIQVLSINEYALSGPSAFTFNIPSQYNNNLNKLEITLTLKMNLSVYNRNLYNLKVETLDLKAWVNANESTIYTGQRPKDIPQLRKLVGDVRGADPNYKPPLVVEIGSGQGKDLIFPSRKNVTFEMDFTLKYTPDGQTGLLDDPVFMEFCDVCKVTIDKVVERPTLITYRAVSTVAFLKTFGYKPDINGEIKIRCPIREDYLQNLSSFSTTNPNASAQDIISAVFGTNITTTNK
ncbi:hypothetical protein HDU96_010868 [Phlyctochytrium bullatum]|nr:hypothetical protein HDU96_010868 [Phlyctochytrium bullatum]